MMRPNGSPIPGALVTLALLLKGNGELLSGAQGVQGFRDQQECQLERQQVRRARSVIHLANSGAQHSFSSLRVQSPSRNSCQGQTALTTACIPLPEHSTRRNVFERIFYGLFPFLHHSSKSPNPYSSSALGLPINNRALVSRTTISQPDPSPTILSNQSGKLNPAFVKAKRNKEVEVLEATLLEYDKMREAALEQMQKEPEMEIPIPDPKGFVGLRNEGATCYMNSMLQTLAHIPALRLALYQLRTRPGDGAHGIVSAMQYIFWQLQQGKTPVSTRPLTNSFGWNTAELFTQHDVQEFSSLILSTLQQTMANTSQSHTISSLFEGELVSTIQCLSVNISSQRVEKFTELHLTVAGCVDVLQSLGMMVQQEMLTKENQYQTENHGKQDAHMGLRIKRFPTVLQLHLKRFEYNSQTNGLRKLDARFAFSSSLELNNPDLLADNTHTHSNNYTLYSVLSHIGSATGGHYCSYIRPLGQSKWLKFDDERVFQVSELEAIEGQFGGRCRSTNAYMLVYVRTESILELSCHGVSPKIPSDLKHHFRELNHSPHQLRKSLRVPHTPTELEPYDIAALGLCCVAGDE